MKIHVLHENDEWLPPFRTAFEVAGIPHDEWHLAHGAFDLDAPPPEGVYYNRMSASSHTRGHDHAAELTAAVIAWLESYGRRVVNGGRAIDLEISKVRQYAAMSRNAIAFPKTRFAVGRKEILETAHTFRVPLILKPNRGGKGLGVKLFNDHNTLESYLKSDLFDLGRDGTVLLQEFISAPDRTITRLEFVGGKFLYAIRVDTRQGFELCPADACRVDDAFCPVSESAPDWPMFEIIDGFTHTNIPLYERFLTTNDIEVAGIEMIVDEDGVAWTYDVNTNTNYNPDAEAAAGLTGTALSGPGAVAAFLGSELYRTAEPSLVAAE